MVMVKGETMTQLLTGKSVQIRANQTAIREICPQKKKKKKEIDKIFDLFEHLKRKDG